MTDNTLLLFDVDKELVNDYSGYNVNRILNELGDAQANCKAALNSGLPLEDAKKIEMVEKACAVAINILPDLKTQLQSAEGTN